MPDSNGEKEDSLMELFTKRPVEILQLVSSLIFLLTSIWSLIAWSIKGNAVDFHVPLLLLGLCVILIGVSFSRGSAAVIATIFIIGILVAPSNYLLRIAHMIARPQSPFGEYAKKYEGEDFDSLTDPTEEVIKNVLSSLSEKGVVVNPEIQKAVGQALTEGEIERMVSRVREEGASTPLRYVIHGGDRLIDFVKRYEGQGIFEEDMLFLKSAGLIVFSGNNYAGAKPTNFGRQVADRIGSFRPDIDINSLMPDRNKVPEDETAIDRTFEISKEHEVEVPEDGRVYWVEFQVKASAKYVITANVIENGDPAIFLFGPNSKTVKAGEDDDGGEDLNSKLLLNLLPGKYYLGVMNLDDRKTKFRLLVKLAEKDPIKAN